jgi:hypothetical protein
MEVFIAVADKLDYKIVGLAIIFLLCWMGYSPIACRSTVVWSDDFNDANYYLQLDQADWGIITHPSEVAYGTWSFDFNANESYIGSTAGINIISTDHVHTALTEDDWSSPEQTAIWILFEVFPEEALLTLNKRYDADITIIDYEVIPVEGWHHIVVTRNTTGWFEVFRNDVLIMEGGDTDITTSELFFVWFEDWQMIDNIVVDDEVLPIDGNGGQIDWWLIAIIGASAVVIILVLVIILKRR